MVFCIRCRISPLSLAVTTDNLVNFLVRLFAHFRQLMIEAQRRATRFRIGKIVTTDASVQPFHSVEDQAVNRVTRGERQAAEDVVIQLGKRVGVIFDFPRAGKYFQRCQDADGTQCG